jgi:plastocyanin
MARAMLARSSEASLPSGSMVWRRIPLLLLAAMLGVLAARSFAAPGDAAVVAGPGNAFTPTIVNVPVGATVTFSNAGGEHNVVWDDLGPPGTPSPPSSSWTVTPSRTFTTAGTYRFYCLFHGGPNGVGMAGTVTVGGGTTSDPIVSIPENPPASSTTTPSTTTTTPATARDLTAPAVTRASAAGLTAAIRIAFRASERGRARVSLSRRVGRSRSFHLVGRRTVAFAKGRNSLRFGRGGIRITLAPGLYRVRIEPRDTAGNHGRALTLSATVH